MGSSPNTITLWIRESTYGFCGNTVHFIEETKQDISIRLFHDKTVIMAAIKLFQVCTSLTNLFITSMPRITMNNDYSKSRISMITKKDIIFKTGILKILVSLKTLKM